MKFNWPQGRDLIGAATGFGADGCSARTFAMSTAAHVNDGFVIAKKVLAYQPRYLSCLRGGKDEEEPRRQSRVVKQEDVTSQRWMCLRC